jgi:hypothetical protein
VRVTCSGSEGCQHTLQITHHGNVVEAPWLVNGGHGASFRHRRPAAGIMIMRGANTPG